MKLFRRKADPISDRARVLNSEIAALEAQIREYETNLERTVQEGMEMLARRILEWQT